jgi:hypothetical protein
MLKGAVKLLRSRAQDRGFVVRVLWSRRDWTFGRAQVAKSAGSVYPVNFLS